MNAFSIRSLGRPRLALPLAAITASLLTGCPAPPLADVSPLPASWDTKHIAHARVNKIDLLFVIDNSRSMRDKQEILKEAVPKLVDRLVAPRCVDAAGAVDPTQTAPCPEGMSPEFTPVSDMHVGVITSSLGAQGGNRGFCEKDSENDQAYLLPSVRADVSGPDFLSWNPTVSATDLSADFRELVVLTGEEGCGFEAPLEAWYRFLVDPEPATETAHVPCNPDDRGNNCVEPRGIDEELLRQRAEFLRPDSLLAIVQLTDEDDCSLNQRGVGHWAVSNANGIPAASAECASNPNDPCCHSCSFGRPNACVGDGGCGDASRINEPVNLLCWDHKRRFGIEFTYPTERYSDALTKKKIRNRAGDEVDNPLLQDRDVSFVFLAGIVGVPWQDLVEDPADPGLQYLTASELRSRDRWQWMLGVPEGDPKGAAPVPPLDPFMIQSVAVRGGRHPATGDEPSKPNRINGGDRADLDAELQYACIFEKLEARDCTGQQSDDCECAGSPDNPKCDGPVLARASANPSTRLLQVLKDFAAGQHEESEDNAIAASICAKQLDDPTADSYGYTPAVHALVERLKDKLKGACLSRELEVADDGTVPCKVVQATPRSDHSAPCPCDGEGQRAVPSDQEHIYREQVAEMEQCDVAVASCTQGYCFCELDQLYLPGNQCQSIVQEEAVTEVGWCYLDGSDGTEEVLDSLGCEGVNPHSLRVVGAKTPGTLSFVSCALKSGA